MATSPPASPSPGSRPMSAIARPTGRSSSRLSMSHSVAPTPKPTPHAPASRASDEDSRTAVRVAVRVRPPLRSTDPGFDLIPQRFQRSMVQTTSNTSLAIDSPHGKKLFVFDRVFDPDVTQDGIWEYLEESVNAFIQGYNVSLLAYGQSGAGKSYTMGTSGPIEQADTEAMGVIPRAATALFEALEPPKAAPPNPKANRASMSHLRGPRGYAQQNTLGDRDWSLQASYVEIYNEQLRDLLIPETTPMHERGNVAIREDVKGNIILTGLHQVDIESVEDLMNALNFGSTIRQTDATAINAKSSRSHAVFSLHLVQRKNKQGQENKRFSMPVEALTGQEVYVTTDSKFHFVDLAGSERLKNTGAQGDRAKEGISINAGLASLGKVISQLSSRQSGSHVSYRDSKLTRLLQDSLGGNAYTYMIACVTPAEFHLSETLNTVQYAQRARAIQSKPRIQQIEEGDKQAVIDRLKAEVAFLREQIRSSSQRESDSPRRATTGPNDRVERQNEREVELQNTLLDTQENYTALSQRHAKLISEMAKARENESSAVNGDVQGETADERISRSNSFAQAVEQVVLEYEKTIQSLEQSLSSTRGTLSSTEASLLEKETKCAYVETINAQLQARVHKLMDRENSTENYLHDLEAKLDGHTSGEEKNSTIIMELRKEISRIRESEASCENYISTLEERLAESDQDSELMQREIDRLEQVVERQRSLGKLDSLLYELDNVQDPKQPEPEERAPSSASRKRNGTADHTRNISHVSRQSQMEEPILEADEDAEGSKISTVNEEEETTVENVDETQSPAQSRFVADKLENVTQELFDLRVEHEGTMHEFEGLHTKYEEAMRTISELRDAFDEARHNRQRDSVVSEPEPQGESFLSDERSSDSKDGPRSSLSRSLSSELSSALESPVTADTSSANGASEDETATTKPDSSTDNLVQVQNQQMTAELERFRTLAQEKAVAEEELAERYAHLESRHAETLDMVEELRTQVFKARAVAPPSPRQSTPVIRRKSSQNLMGVDRAQRSFASLRNIALDHFHDTPDVMQNFELNVNAAMHELHARSERINELEADVASAKKEMETKMTIITGLTRERSSLKTSPMDMSMVATLRDQLEQNERQLSEMRSSHSSRERELMSELDELKMSLINGTHSANGSEDKVGELQAELASWEGKHKQTLDAMETTERNMKATIQQLETEITSVNARLAQSQISPAENVDEKQQMLVGSLSSEVDEYKAIVNSNAARIAELESEHQTARMELDDTMKSYDAAVAETNRHKDLVAKLQEQLEAHEQASKAHQDGLELLHKNHEAELAELKAREQTGYEEQMEVLMQEHAESVQKLETELMDAREDLAKVATQVAFALGVDMSIEKLTERIDGLVTDSKAGSRAAELEATVSELTTINDAVMKDLETTKKALGEMLSGKKGAPTLVKDQIAAVRVKMSDLESKSVKNSRLVEELEEQLQNNFDEAQMTNNRLSTLQTERGAQLDEAVHARTMIQAELDAIRDEYASLHARFEEVAHAEGRRASTNSTIRKSASHASLPSPPPAIPLPPLPGTASSSPTPGAVPGSPTTSLRPGSKDNFAIAQITEDQEARIRTIEKHLYAERQLTQTLEEALTDLEKQSNKVKADCDAWRKRAGDLEGEVKTLKDRPAPDASGQDNRWSINAVEEERKKRQAAEAARRQLEERMNAINKGKKKKGSLNCF